MDYFEDRYLDYVQYVSIVVGVLLFVGFFLSGDYFPEPPFWIPLDRRLNNGFALSILIMIAPPAILQWSNGRFFASVEDNLPLFLRDVTNEVQSGVPLMFALESISSNDYGPISGPLLKTMNRINVTSDIESSLIWLGDQLVIPQAKRLVLILVEAYNTGGRVSEILESSLDMFTVLSNQKRDREELTSPYLYIVYLGTGVFLIISLILLTEFLSPMAEITLDPNVQASGLISGLFNLDYYWGILFWAAILEATVGGLLGGKIKHGSLAQGLSYASILLVVTLLFFNSWLFTGI
jgi:archaeal flagellar protein FlaJ